MDNSRMIKYTFSGHETFQCRQLWLKKGFDFIQQGNSFTNPDASLQLGVGKNMVSAIRYWLKAFNIINFNDELTEFGVKLFDEKEGYDPFLEDEASIWLLHYQLIKTGYASLYNMIFNEFRKEKIFFTKEVFMNYIKRKKEADPAIAFGDNTIATDFGVFIKMYHSDVRSKDLEDSNSGVLSDIELLKITKGSKEEQFVIENTEREKLPKEILLFSILDNPHYGNSISLHALEHDFNSPCTIFALNKLGLTNKISDIVVEHKSVIFTDHAGMKELQFKTKPTPYSILDIYYGK